MKGLACLFVPVCSSHWHFWEQIPRGLSLVRMLHPFTFDEVYESCCSWKTARFVTAADSCQSQSPRGAHLASFVLIFISSNSTTDSQESADTDCIEAPYSLFSLIAPVKLYCMKRHQAGLFLTRRFENWHWVLAGNELGSSYSLLRTTQSDLTPPSTREGSLG